MSVQVVETYVVWVGKTDRIASFRKVEGYPWHYHQYSWPIQHEGKYFLSSLVSSSAGFTG